MSAPAGAFGCSGRGRSSLMRRGEVTPPYGSITGGAQQRADVPKAWLPPLRPAGDEGRHAGSSCPTGGCGEPPRSPWVAAHSGAYAARVRRNGRESRQRSSPKCPATPDNPSVSLRLTAPFAQGSLWDGGCGLPRRFAPRNDSSDPLSFRGGPTDRGGNPSFFTMDGGRAAEVVGPYGRSTEAPATGRCRHRPLRNEAGTAATSRAAL